MLSIFTVKHLHAADNVIVLEEGHIRYQGTFDSIQQQGYVPTTNLSRPHFDMTEEKKYATADSEQKEHVAEQEDAEAAIAEKSLGWAPYLFFARMTTWPRAILAAVRNLDSINNPVQAQIYDSCFS
jgi:ATP-binding cassette, subfamily C (CFTR/MRP), member 1